MSASATTTATVPTWVFGAKGMLAGELLRLLDLHPALELKGAVSRSEQSVVSAHPHLVTRAKTSNHDEALAALGSALAGGGKAVVFLALPHGESAALWAKLSSELGALTENLYVVDLAADFRLANPARYQQAYGHPHPTPQELARFAYGLVELDRAAVLGAKRVAAPGCFATALQLACVPAAEAKLLDTTRPWILNGITGSSGSGVEPKPGTHHPWRHANLWAYSLDGHRHEAELAQALERCGAVPPIHFVAHSGPMARGIHMTAALPLARKVTTAEVHAIYAARFAGATFVEVLEGKVPDLRSISASNRAQLAVSVRGDVLNVLCTLDNMTKGGAGQALQCANLMLGFPEHWGLPRAGLGVN